MVRQKQKESLQMAFTLLLGPKTNHHLRIQAMQHLLQHEHTLPLLLQTLNTYPEPTTPTWPWSPPQYTYIGRLLLQLCQKTQTEIESLLIHPVLTQAPGPVLWISIITAIALLSREEHETFLCQGLETPWANVHNAAAQTLATQARYRQLDERTHTILRNYQYSSTNPSTSFAISCAQLNNGLLAGLNGILALLQTSTSPSMQKVALFWLATDPPPHLTRAYKKQLVRHLLPLLLSSEKEIAQNAAHAFSNFATPITLDGLYALLGTASAHQQYTLLISLEEMACYPALQKSMRIHDHLTHILPLLQSEDTAVRRQSCYTLAAIGGEYATAVLGTIVLDKGHPSHLYAIESLRHLYNSNRAPLRIMVIRWLLQALCESSEVGQTYALELLTLLVWQAREQKKSTYWHVLSRELLQHEGIRHVLQSCYASTRQKALKLLTLCDTRLNTIVQLHPLLLCMLRSDKDADIRAGIATLCQVMKARWALPDLLQALLDPDTNVAQAVLASLETIATVKDTTVLCTLTELTHFQATTNSPQVKLAYNARLLLEKWQEATNIVSSTDNLFAQNN